MLLTHDLIAAMSNHMGYEASDLQPGCVTVNEQLTALAVFSCLPNSHPFNERRVAVSEPVKIGRSVPRARPSPNNVIFDCKVLSRNHALLHYTNGMVSFINVFCTCRKLGYCMITSNGV